MRGRERRQAADYANYADGRAISSDDLDTVSQRAHSRNSRNPRPVSFFCPSFRT